MCGIVGFCDLSHPPGHYAGWIKRMLAAIAHRGPDEKGLFFDERAGLGTARLSIIDLEDGTQPMSDGTGRYWLAFNGEIFNYIELKADLLSRGVTFETRSDTEVLLKALITWGRDALDRLEGQFAFLLYDTQERRLLFARDRWGERPLFYTEVEGGYAFGSEIKCLFTLPFVTRALDPGALRRVGQFWVSLPGETCFEGIRSLPPGHVGTVENGRLSVRRYYALPPGSTKHGQSFDEAKALLAEKLRASVQKRLRSDVPVGVYLSGGLDSAIVAALAQEESPYPLRSFSVAFRDEDYDESAFQEAAARHLGTRHHVLRITRNAIAEYFPETIWHAETALFRAAPVPLYLLARGVREAGIKVVLTGEGADEIFLGYDLFKETLFRERYDTFLDDDARLAALRRIYPGVGALPADKAQLLLSLYRRPTTGLFAHEVRFSVGPFTARLFQGDAGDAEVRDDSRRLWDAILAVDPDFPERSTLSKAQVVEFQTLLAGYLLSSQGDRMTAAHGVEGRYPFLDTDLVAVGFGISEDYRLKGGVTEKHVLREAFRDRLPPAVTDRLKRSYRAPNADCFLGPDAPDWVRDTLTPQVFRRVGFLDEAFATRFMNKLWKRTAPPWSVRDNITFMLLISMLQLHRQFVEEFPDVESPGDDKLVRLVDGRTHAAARP
ncbi:MAG: asparagine synthase (glutamine-hydrolyzing) [Alphaproteobacteria bacterium]